MMHALMGWLGAESGINDVILFAVCGAVGSACVAIGLLYAWRIRLGMLSFVSITIIAGTLGGFLFHLLEGVTGLSSSDSGNSWTLMLFTVWQTVLFIGIAVALRFSSFHK